MVNLKKNIIKNFYLFAVIVTIFTPNLVFSHTINGYYARLINCDYSYSQVRGESGYTGTYEVMGEIYTQYFGSQYCPA
tara:strand:- start:213 stop:446 length:234 start_codon:yes stop_codon:yes gene_type:complete